MSVQTILSSPLARGMARGAILQSGGGIQALHTTPGKQALWEVSQRLMDHLGVSTLEELRQVPAGKLRDAAYAVQGQGLSWCPHVDGWLLPDTTDAQAESGAIHDIATMIGSTGTTSAGGAAPRGGGPLVREPAEAGPPAGVPVLFRPQAAGGPSGGVSTPASCGTSLKPCPAAGAPGGTRLGAGGAIKRLLGKLCKNRRPQWPGLPPWHPYAGEHKEALVLQ